MSHSIKLGLKLSIGKSSTLKGILIICIFLNKFDLQLSAQVDSPCEYSKVFISNNHIKSITEWVIDKNDSLKQNSINRIYNYDNNGNIIDYHGGGDSNPRSHIKFVYDSGNHLLWRYYTDSNGFVSQVEAQIYNGNLLLDKRTYWVPDSFHNDTIGLIYKSPCYGDKKTYDLKGNMIRNSFYSINSSPKLELGIEDRDTLNKLPLLKTCPDYIKFVRTIENNFDNSGNLIRQITTPESNLYINDSFAYDKNKNLIYKITFNSGDISFGNSRKKVDNQHRETRYQNSYNVKEQLIETRTYFNNTKSCCLRDTFIYDSSGMLRMRIVFKTYPDSDACFTWIGGGEVNNLRAHKTRGNPIGIVISDTLFYYEYNTLGSLIDEREYCGVGQKGMEGTLFTRKLKKTNSQGVMLRKATNYYEHLYIGNYTLIYDYFLNKEGLISKIYTDGKPSSRISYTFYD